MTPERVGMLKGASVAMVVGLLSLLFNSVFSRMWASGEWVTLVGYFGFWALVGGAIGYWGSKRNAGKS
jgi:hypothetical protein